MKYDVVIIGAGAVGCATARELSKYDLKVLVLEKGHDICSGASKANTGMIHAGYDPVPGTKEAKFNAPGSKMMYQLCDELEVPYQKSGTTIFATDESGLKELDKLVEYAEANHVHVEIVRPPKLYELQPDMSPAVKALLWVPEGGVTNPFTVTCALAENAWRNGVAFRVDAEVTRIKRNDDGWRIEAVDRTAARCDEADREDASHMEAGQEESQRDEAGQEASARTEARPNRDLRGADWGRDTQQPDGQGILHYEARMVVNCAGAHSDTINNMVSRHTFRIIPRFGAHVILDRKWSEKLTTTLMETPHDLPGGGHTKGMAIAPSLGGTMLLGCDATETEDPDMTEVPAESIRQITEYFKEAWKYLPLGSDGSEFPMDAIIGVFGGCRPHANTNDFVIGEPEDAPGFVNAGGTESPAFTSSPAIGAHVAGICIDRLQPRKREDFEPHRKAKPAFREMTNDERIRAIAEDPDYAKVVCRCEMVTEAEIRDAIRRPLGARSIAGVKMRTRAGMGRCQGGFCSSRVLQILCEELGLDPLEVTQCGGASHVLVARSGELEAGNERN